MRTTIGNTRFWTDCDTSSIGIRSVNLVKGTQPFECSLNKRARLLDIHFYESSDESNLELRLSFRLLWLSVNMLICTLTARENTKRFDDRNREYGWYFIDDQIVLRFGYWAKYWGIPFRSLIHMRSELLSLDRSRVVYISPKNGAFEGEEYKRRIAAKEVNSASFGYRYELLKGGVQDVVATVNVERCIHRWKWTPFHRVVDSINIQFSEEVGEKRGSYKGGCIGCGYTMKPGETAIHALRRMERERRFER